MTKARTLANFISDGSTLADGAISVSEVSGAAPLASPTFTGTTTQSGVLNMNTNYIQFQGNVSKPNVGAAIYRPAADSVAVVTNNQDRMVISNTEVNFNEGSQDTNFRVESDSNDHMLFVDAGNNRVGIGQSSPDVRLHVTDGSSGATGNSAGQVFVEGSTSAGISIGSATTNSSYIWFGDSDNIAQGRIRYDNQADKFEFRANNVEDVLVLGGSEAVFNEVGADIDFRIESDTDANFFVADADSGDSGSIGIHTNNPSTDLDIVGGMRSRYRLTNAPGSQTGGVNDNYWRLGTLTLGPVAAAEITLYGTASYSSGYSIAGKTTIVLRGGTSSTILDGTWWYEGEFTSGQVKDCVYVPTGTANEFDIYVKLGNYQCFDHEVVTGGKWVSAITNTGSSSPPSGYQQFSREYSIWNGDNNFWCWNVNTGSGNVFNENGGNIDFRVESDSNSNLFHCDANNDSVGIGGTGSTQGKLVVTNSTSSYNNLYLGMNNPTVLNSFAPMLYLQANADYDIQDGYKMVQFADQNTVIGSISTAASSTNVAYNTSSDERLKENIIDAGSQLEGILGVRVREFDWKKNGAHSTGFIAQELHQIFPEAVSEGGDDANWNPWSVDYGRMTPYIIKAMQEQQTMIETLEARIAALENA